MSLSALRQYECILADRLCEIKFQNHANKREKNIYDEILIDLFGMCRSSSVCVFFFLNFRVVHAFVVGILTLFPCCHESFLPMNCFASYVAHIVIAIIPVTEIMPY